MCYYWSLLLCSLCLGFLALSAFFSFFSFTHFLSKAIFIGKGAIYIGRNRELDATRPCLALWVVARCVIYRSARNKSTGLSPSYSSTGIGKTNLPFVCPLISLHLELLALFWTPSILHFFSLSLSPRIFVLLIACTIDHLHPYYVICSAHARAMQYT